MRWQIQYKVSEKNPQDRQQEIVNHLLSTRGILSDQDKQTFFSPPHPSTFTLTDIGIDPLQADKAIARIQTALTNQEQVIVYGDYDADGITATAIMWETLHSLGCKALPYLPDRFTEGYGMRTTTIQHLQNLYPDLKLIITVDLGVTAHEAIGYCQQQGIDVIVSDHHQPAETLPQALAVIHTIQTSGSAVVWWFCHHLKVKLSAESLTLLPDDGLELAAIGTVADVIPLLGINRSLVAHGLTALRMTRRPGLLALLQLAKVDSAQLDTYHLGFIIGPRLNAMGRLEHALDSLRLLCTTDPSRAQTLASTLNKTNQDRQQLTQTTFEHALQEAEKLQDHHIIIVSGEAYPEGIIGLVAGKLVEKFHKPAIVFSHSVPHAKASARSIASFNIIEAICTAQDLLITAGGHPMAAGLTISIDHLEDFRAHLQTYALERLTPADFQANLTIDALLDFSDLTINLYNQLIQFAPFGHANHEPLFVTQNATLQSFKPVGQQQKHLKLQISQNDHTFNAIAFNQGQRLSQLKSGQKLDIAYYLTLNQWNGQTALELRIKDWSEPKSPV